jgi:transcriptional regulator of heat shock response
MVTIQKANKAAERLAETTRDSYKTFVDHTVALQERNVRFAQGVVDGATREIRHQAESNRAVIGEIVERAEKQRDAFQTLVEESVDAYMDFVYAPFSYYKEGLQVARKATR